MIRVLVVRDGGLFGVHVRVVLNAQPDITVVGTLVLDNEVAIKAAPLAPDVIVIDTEFMVSQVLPTAAELHARIPSCSLLVLCDPTKRGMLPPRRHAGYVSFLLKDASGTYLADSARRLPQGERVRPPPLPAALAES